MSLTSSSSNWYAFSCPYDFKRAFKIAFNKFFVCIVDTPFSMNYGKIWSVV